MPGWLSEALLFLANAITSLFVSPDTLNFSIIRMVVAVLLFTLIVIIIAFRKSLKSWVMGIIKKKP